MDNETKILLSFLAGIVAGLCMYMLSSYVYLQRRPKVATELLAWFMAARGLCRRHAHEELDHYFTEALEDGAGEDEPCPYLDGEDEDDDDDAS